MAEVRKVRNSGKKGKGQRIKASALFLILLSFLLFPLTFGLPSFALAGQTHLILTNWTAGELSPLMEGRTDMEAYRKGCLELENIFIYPHGPATKRPGFKYVSEVKDSSKRVRLIPFEFSTEQAYILEFGDQYIRFYMDQGQILSGGTPYEIASPYTEEDLDGLKYCQSADVMILTHPDHPPRQLARTGHTSWTLTAPGGAGYVWTANPFGGANGCPSACAWHENRLIFSGTTVYPNSVWLSKSGDYYNFTTGVNDDDAIEIALASNQVNAIQWLVPSIYLTLGTTAGEWRISATDPDDPITPTNITAKRELVYGSADRMAVNMGKDILFLQRSGKKVRKLAYNWESAGYVAPDVTVLAEHVTGTGVSDFAYQKDPFSTLWVPRQDGTLLGLTYLPEHEVFAWHRHTTQGEFESAAAIPAGTKDDLYVVVKREINGGVSRFVEVLADQFTGTDLAEAVYLDSAILYSGTPTAFLSGATHLMNTPVYALADGVVVSGITVDAVGGVTLPAAAERVVLGLPYTATLETMRLEAPADDGGTSQGLIKRISKAILRLYKTRDFQAGPDEDHMRDFSTGSGVSDIFTGDVEIDYPAGYERDAHVIVKQPDPLPMTIRAMILKIATGD